MFGMHICVQLPHKLSRCGNCTGRNPKAVVKLAHFDPPLMFHLPKSNAIRKIPLTFREDRDSNRCNNADGARDPLITYPLRIKKHEIRAEVANTEQDRLRGLMFRDKLAENSGMIFFVPTPEASAMWMKNTRIALSVAFIDASGRILNIAEMEPFFGGSATLRPARQPMRWR